MGPNPLNQPLKGIIGQDIILDKFGNQVAYRCGAIWPGPNIWSRFNDPSHPDGYLKVEDSKTGVCYWVIPYKGTVTNGKWVDWQQGEPPKEEVGRQEEMQKQEPYRQGQRTEKEAEEELMEKVQLDMMKGLFGSLPTRPRPNPSTYDPTS